MESATRTAWPKDDRLWQVQAFGEAHQSPGVPSELSLDVCLAWVREPRVAEPPQTKVFVKASVPQLPSLHLGLQWRNGLPVDLAWSEEFDDELDFSPDNCRFIDAGEMFPKKHKAALTSFLIPPAIHSFAPYLRSRCLAIGYEGRRDVVIIPCAEIARSWYFRSTDLALRLTEGPLNLVEEDRLFNPKYDPTVLTGEWQVRVRTGLDHLDAYVVAMIRCDPYAKQQVEHMTTSLVRQAVGREPRFIEARPPLLGTWPLRAEGRWFSSGGVRRFLTYYLTAVQYPPNPGLLHWNLDNTNQVLETGDPERKKRNSWGQTPDRKPVTSQHELGNDAEPDKNISSVHEVVVMADFIGAPGLRRMEPEPQTTETVPGRTPEAPADGPVSTGEGGNLPGNPVRLKIHADRASGATRNILPAGFKRVIELMNHLNRHSPLRCRVVPGSRDIAGDAAEPRSLFRTQPKTDGGDVNPWVLIDGRPRQFLVMEMELEGSHTYAIEVERRRSKKTGKDREQYTLAVVVGEEAARLGIGQFGILSGVCALNEGVWPKKYNSLRVVKLKHSYSTTANFALGIENAVIKLVPSVKATILSVRPRKGKKSKRAAKVASTG